MKHLNIHIEEDQELNGVTATVPAVTITVATPNKIKVDGVWVPNVDGVGKYARMHNLDTNTSYLWDGDVDDVDENTPLDDPNWKEEN